MRVAWPLLLALAGPPALAAPAQLLSIVGLGVPDGRYVSTFAFRTWNVRVLAVCHIPPGWTMTAGRDADPGGVLSGSASEGMTFLSSANVGELTGLFLVQVENFHAARVGRCARSSCVPATFSGSITIGRYLDREAAPTRIRPSNIRLVAAPRCPDPV